MAEAKWQNVRGGQTGSPLQTTSYRSRPPTPEWSGWRLGNPRTARVHGESQLRDSPGKACAYARTNLQSLGGCGLECGGRRSGFDSPSVELTFLLTASNCIDFRRCTYFSVATQFLAVIANERSFLSNVYHLEHVFLYCWGSVLKL